ncbi:Rap1a/Tai family immunity protein [Luminiphilus sp.]|nr:Rap1a/Tai family immunity protein [Luminiphilus sp.]
MDSYETLHHWGIAESRMCVPGSATSEDLSQVVVEWLSKRPEEELVNDAAGPHAVNAIGEKWPCNREWKQLSPEAQEG